MDAQTDITTYLEQGKQALAQGKAREAAIAYAHGAQLEPENPLVHLGLAEANLALGSNSVVLIACRKTQELASSGPLYHLAQALLMLLDRQYETALDEVNTAIKDDPGNAYAHALRSYLLRATNQTYDAGLARARASRLSFGGTFENCFPPLEPTPYTNGYQDRSPDFVAGTPAAPETSRGVEREGKGQRQQYEREPVPTWSRTPTQRRMLRFNFWLNQRPHLLTFILIGLTALGYVLFSLLGPSLGLTGLLQNGFGRIFLATFIPSDVLSLLFNALSLFFVGSTVETLYGKWRYLLIYVITGMISNIALYMFLPGAPVPFLGAMGAIFGIFGAFGAFFIANRRVLGPVANSMLGQWIFWLVLNLFFVISGGIGLPSLIAGIISGMVLGIVLLPNLRRRS